MHAFDNFKGGLDRLGFLHGNRTVLAYLLHSFSDDFADGRVPVGRDGGNLLDLFLVLDLPGDPGELRHGSLDGLLNAALNTNRVRARSDKFQTFPVNRFGEQCGRGGAVACVIAGFAGDFADHLRTHVFAGIRQFDFLGDRHAVLGHRWASEFFVDHYVAALRAERGLHCATQLLHSQEKGLARRFVKDQLFCCHKLADS